MTLIPRHSVRDHGRSVFTFGGKHFADHHFPWGQVSLDGFPDDVHVDTQVFVNDDVTHPDDVVPIHGGIPSPQRLGQMACRLANRLQGVHRGILLFIVRGKVFLLEALNETLDLVDPGPSGNARARVLARTSAR